MGRQGGNKEKRDRKTEIRRESEGGRQGGTERDGGRDEERKGILTGLLPQKV